MSPGEAGARGIGNALTASQRFAIEASSSRFRRSASGRIPPHPQGQREHPRRAEEAVRKRARPSHKAAAPPERDDDRDNHDNDRRA